MTIPDLISWFRLLAAPVIVGLLLRQQFTAALLAFAVAAASDAVDGFVARRYHRTSEFGAHLDAVADKVLMVAVFASLWWLGVMPLWLLALIGLRDVAIVIGATVLHHRRGRARIAPSWLSKTNTAAQALLAGVGLVHLAAGSRPGVVAWALEFVVVATIGLSAVGYAVALVRRLRRTPAAGGDGPDLDRL